MTFPREPASRSRSLKRSAIVACATAAIASNLSNGESGPSSLPATLFVTNCDDHGPGSLRDTIAAAVNHDNVDLTRLTCSVITLTSGELPINVDNLGVIGGTQVITAQGNSRVISHNGVGTIGLTELVLKDGAVTAHYARGGCLYSRGDIELYAVTVSNCTLTSIGDFGGEAAGGGIFAAGSAMIRASTIADNSIVPTSAPYSAGLGGGIFVGDGLYMSLSTISGNSIHGEAGYCYGGGLLAGYVRIEYSTVSYNEADVAGGARFGGPLGALTASRIVNSTLSNNSGWAVVSDDVLLEVRDSTIAFNGGGINMSGLDEYLSVRSSIVANNGAGGSDYDIFVSTLAGGGAIIGSNNLIQTSNVPVPPDTIRSDPLLGPLADNGGPTMTLALMQGSPAIDAGGNSPDGSFDQRYTGFPRIVGIAADIGAFEVQTPQSPPDSIFSNGFD